MRKIVTLLCVLCASATLLAQTENLKGIHPYQEPDPENVSQEHAYWSITPYAGINWFFGDFNSDELRNTPNFPSVGIAADCWFNPAWALGIEYGFSRWKLMGTDKVDGAGNRLNADTLLLGNGHMGNIFLATDLVNLIHPFAKKKPVSVIASVGVGGLLHKNSVYYDMSEKNTEGRSARGNTAAHPNLRGSMNKYDVNPLLKFALNVEFNINRTLALGVRGAYNLFLSDMIDNRQFNPNTDGVVDLTLNLRVKLEAVKKTHARNVPGRDFPDVRAITVREAKGYIADDVADQIETAYAKGAEAAKVHDTLIIHHDTIILVQHDSVIYAQGSLPAALAARATNAAAVAAEESAPRVYSRAAQNFYIYFEPFLSNINEDGLISIQQVADLMNEEPNFYAVIVGYCDNTGTPAANYELGEIRARKVADELREEYGIDAARIYSASHGAVVGGRSKAAYAPNRRVAIQLVDKATFDKRRAELEKEKANRGKVELPVMATVVADNNTTLAQLARRYYSNTNCWVYIFGANKDKLMSPNKVPQGTSLDIPKLTEDEAKITKEQSQKMYNEIRNM